MGKEDVYKNTDFPISYPFKNGYGSIVILSKCLEKDKIYKNFSSPFSSVGRAILL